jgi:hypothetical protein
LDLGVSRSVRLRDKLNLQFRLEAFNATNRPNLNVPNATIGDTRVGTITSVVSPERQMQAAVRLSF